VFRVLLQQLNIHIVFVNCLLTARKDSSLNLRSHRHNCLILHVKEACLRLNCVASVVSSSQAKQEPFTRFCCKEKLEVFFKYLPQYYVPTSSLTPNNLLFV